MTSVGGSQFRLRANLDPSADPSTRLGSSPDTVLFPETHPDMDASTSITCPTLARIFHFKRVQLSLRPKLPSTLDRPPFSSIELPFRYGVLLVQSSSTVSILCLYFRHTVYSVALSDRLSDLVSPAPPKRVHDTIFYRAFLYLA